MTSVDGPALPPLSEPVAKVAEPTGGTPVTAYAGAGVVNSRGVEVPADAGVSATDFTGLPVVPAGVRDIPAASGPSSEAPASISLPPNEPGPYWPTYCFRSYCICCGRGAEYITTEREPVQGATRCTQCGGRMIVEFA